MMRSMCARALKRIRVLLLRAFFDARVVPFRSDRCRRCFDRTANVAGQDQFARQRKIQTQFIYEYL